MSSPAVGGGIKVGVGGFTLQVEGKHGRWVEEEEVEISLWVVPEEEDIWASIFLKISATKLSMIGNKLSKV